VNYYDHSRKFISRRLALALVSAGVAPSIVPALAQNSQQTGRLTARPQADRPPPSPSPPRGISLLGLDRNHHDRDAILYAPANFDPRTPLPLLLFLHGAGQNGTLMVRALQDSAERHGVLLLAPTSRATTWDMRRAPACEDSASIDSALAQVFAATTIDPHRIGIGGLSDGASFALSLGLANGDLFGEVMSFSAGFFHVPVRVGRPRIFLSHGHRDAIIDFRIGRQIADRLIESGYDVTFRPFEGGHGIPPDGLEAALLQLEG
jgi:predicted esterase